MSTSPVLSSPVPSDTESSHSQQECPEAASPVTVAAALPSTKVSTSTELAETVADVVVVPNGTVAEEAANKVNEAGGGVDIDADHDHQEEVEALVGDNALEEDTDLTMSSGDLLEEHTCQLCEEKFKQPRILSCLHVFCTPCLEKQAGSADDLQEDGECPQPQQGVLVCTMCKQETRLPSEKGVPGLPLDHVMLNMMDMSAIEDMQIICTSCKAKEKAVARCADCASFLCSNCVTAHQYMRCFENHKVESFEELKSSGSNSLHKPIFCQVHSSEVVKSFCKTCQTAICNECLLHEHKQPEHQSDRIADLEAQQSEELKLLVTEAKSKLDFCKEASSGLENALTELQMQRDNARGLIDETFQSYKVVLEKRKEDLLKTLEDIHSSKELNIMELFYAVEKTQERIEDGSTFTERLLANGNATEILLLRKNIVTQLLSLINNTPKAEMDVKIEFESDQEKFKQAIQSFFGCFKEQLAPEGAEGGMLPDHQLQLLNDMHTTASMHSSFENEGINLPPGLLSPSPEEHLLPPVSAPEFVPSIPTLAPLNIPGLSNLANMTGVSAHTINSIASSIQSLTTERSSSRNSYSPAMSDSGISVDAPSSNSSGTNQPIIDIAALARLGSVNVNTQGQITLNGQVIPGLNMNNVSGRPLHGLTTQTSMTAPPTPCTPITPTPDSGIGSLLNPVTSRAQTPLGDISGLLSQPHGLAVLGSGLSSGSGHNLLGTPGDMSLNINTSMSGGLTPTGPQTPSAYSAGAMHGHPPFPVRNNNKISAMQIRLVLGQSCSNDNPLVPTTGLSASSALTQCKFGQLGPGKGQFNSPHGFCLGMEEDIIVADTNNHRIQVFEKTGEFKYQFGIPGREEGQLWYPRKVAVIRHTGKYVVCDRGNERSRMQIFTKSGHFIKKIAIRYIDIVAGLAITQQGHIVAVDSVSPTVFCIAESGELIKWFDCSDYMREPSDIAISGKEYFVCDFKGHCVVVFNEDGQFMRRIGCENITNYPNGIDISDAGDVLIGDSHGNRFHVAVFQRDGSLIGEFECPYVKVSRCCGLKITSEGYVVTLAKNNHHVLVLNTLYIT